MLTPAALAKTLQVGLGYLPDVQFAPFYVAQAEGYFKDQGLEVTFQHGYTSELYPLLAQGKLDFVVGDAEDVMTLAQPGVEPFVYVLALYQHVPNALFSLTDKGIKKPADLRGKRIGVPGLFGSSYTSLQAILKEGGLKEDEVGLEQIGFTQLEAIVSGRVDAALGFVNNEPLVLKAQGIAVNTIEASAYSPAPGVGVITRQDALADKATLKAFLRAVQQGMVSTLEDPEQAFAASKGFVENLTDDRMPVLKATLPLMRSAYEARHAVGATDPKQWQELFALLKETGRLKTEAPVASYYDNSFLDAAITLPGR